MCFNHPELVHKHPTHLASSVLVRFDEVRIYALRFIQMHMVNDFQKFNSLQ